MLLFFDFLQFYTITFLLVFNKIVDSLFYIFKLVHFLPFFSFRPFNFD